MGDSDEEEEEDDEEDGSLVDTTTTATRTTTATTNGRPLIGILSQPNCWTRRVTHYSSNCSCNCSIICQVCGIWRCKELFVPLSYNEPEESLAKLNCLQIFQLCVSFFVFCLIEFIKDKERDELFSNFVQEKMCCQDVKLITVLQRQRKEEIWQHILLVCMVTTRSWISWNPLASLLFLQSSFCSIFSILTIGRFEISKVCVFWVIIMWR